MLDVISIINRENKMKRSLCLIIILSAFVLLNGCGKKQKDSGSIVLHDILQLQQAQINSFDPVDAYHAGHIQIVKQIFNTLTDVDLKGKIIPSLAESWETIDGINWVLKLRKDVLFAEDVCFKDSNERAFKAEDVKFTFERLLSKDSKSLGISYFNNLLGIDEFRNGESNGIEGIVIKDDYTIHFKLKEKDYNFPNLLSLPYTSIVKRQAIAFYGKEFKLHPVGTGSFKLERFESNEQIVFVRNESYWEKQNNMQLPFIDEVVLNLTTDDNLAFLMFKNHKSDFLELNLPIQRQLENTKMPFEYTKEILKQTQLNFYLFNLEKITDKNIRQGINYAISREKLQSIINEQGVVTQSLFPSIFGDLANSNPILTYSPEKARNLLNSKITIKLVCFEDIISRTLADFIAKELQIYSIDVKIEAVAFPVLVERLTKGNYDMIQIYWGLLYADVCHFLNPFRTTSFPPAGNNFNKYSNPDFDTLIQEAPKMPLDKQHEQYLKAQEIILNDMPFFLAYYKNGIRVSDAKFEMPLHPLGYRFYKYARKSPQRK
ncbi:MAG: hypothetical protein AYP45_03620 [Candidatus Brocadia carolinensis]|uniref:Solute-binding protein family 5 domain-containing protein n=1 Tax=Candidatus Brocadia carolinensis TaxID=1004156 RepID=A0A1V4AWB7_9BACT|nr:MAG: hypothetical protein AYP45_03620 [Candidatus Brocadia caroliniensis]